MSTTPKTDATHFCSKCGYFGDEAAHPNCNYLAMEFESVRLKRELIKSQEKIATFEMINRGKEQQLESDSVVASCDCLTKTPEVKHHKKGCKYRLITERNEARGRIAELEKTVDERVLFLTKEEANTRCEEAKAKRERDELSQRLIDQTAAYKAKDAEQMKRIQELQEQIQNCANAYAQVIQDQNTSIRRLEQDHDTAVSFAQKIESGDRNFAKIVSRCSLK